MWRIDKNLLSPIIALDIIFGQIFKQILYNVLSLLSCLNLPNLESNEVSPFLDLQYVMYCHLA